ncbi:MAG: hypothetical protein EOP83_36850, partial [Verrucomicrobiaceae bacterium]
MTPRRIIRWKSFWLGVVVLVFLGWGWVSTRTEQAMLYCVVDGWIYAAASGSGSVSIAIHPQSGMPFEWGFDRMPSPEEDPPLFAPAFENGWIWDGPKGAEGYIALGYWVVVLGFVVAWGGFLM